MKNVTKGFMQNRISQATKTAFKSTASVSALMLVGALASAPAMAQQAGSIKGKVTQDGSGASMSGVTVTATSSIMPKARTATTNEDGSFNLPLLKPGNYQLTFQAQDGSVKRVNVQVLLDQASRISMVMDTGTDATEVITISGSALVREGDSSITNSLSGDVLQNVPVGQQYRDIMKLIPGVQVTENSVLGPSAGGSGRDNKYSFDGVDISLPMFGNLSSEPSTHDIANVSIDRGAAKAVGFNRSGGFAINTDSKSGTNEFKGGIEYKIQPKSFVSDKDLKEGVVEETTDRNWLVLNAGGPIIEDELFFYGSYYRPEQTRSNKATAYGEAKNFESVRDELFGKLTWAPTEDLLMNLSYRYSDKEETGDSVGSKDADSTSLGATAKQKILTLDGSYIIDDYTTFSFQYGEYDLETASVPDTIYASVTPSIGASLPLDMLDQIGLFRVPELNADGTDVFNAGAQALIDRYGYVDSNGVRQGGGSIGGDDEFNDQNFYRKSFKMSLDHEMEVGDAIHNLHFGFQWKEGEEVLSRTSNGWGRIGYLGGDPVETEDGVGATAFYVAEIQQMSLSTDGSAVAPIVSSTKSYNIEINDEIEYEDFTYNIGFLISNDILYGQGLKENANNVSGYELAPGHKYKMYEVDFKDMIQPRLGIQWRYDGENKVFANYASYNPEASSLARAASWDRNSRKTIKVQFDENGNFLRSDPASGSSGKFFQEGIKPRRTDEITIGTEQFINDNLITRAHVRHRKTVHPWEDTWNGSRLYGEYGPFGGVPQHIADKGLYIPELDAYRAEVGGSSYVIAELDDAENKYWEVSLEAEYSDDKYYLSASYTWSNYYGNYDQDITSGSSDGNLFIGSSNLADGRGRQLWDGKYGKLNGNRPHIFKAYGTYTTDWDGVFGAYLLYQSGDVWEKWDGDVYQNGYSDTIRYAEWAGSRREASHWQMDVSYEQKFDVMDGYVLAFQADIFNLFDNQTGYNYDPYADSSTFGEARNLINPRRIQLSFNLSF